MKKHICAIVFLICVVQALHAQEKIIGTYYSGNIRHFAAADANIITQPFIQGPLAPFMIKGNNPFNSWENKVGFIDTTGKIIIQPKYGGCSYFNGQYALVWRYEGRKIFSGIVNLSGKEVVPSMYNRVLVCENGLFFISTDQKTALISAKGDTIIPFDKYSGVSTGPPLIGGDYYASRQFQWFVYPLEHLAFKDYIGLRSGSKWAIVNRFGKEVAAPKFDRIYPFVDGYAVMGMNGKMGLTDVKGKITIKPIYDHVNLNGKIVFVDSSGKKGVFSVTGKKIIPVLYNSVYSINAGFEVSDSVNARALFSKKGNQISPFDYDNRSISDFAWGNEKKVYIANKANKLINIYDGLSNMENQYNGGRHFFYRKKLKWGLLDTLGYEITPPLFDEINIYKLSGMNRVIYIPLAAVKQQNKWGIIDAKGKMHLDCVYEDFAPLVNTLLVKSSGKYGLIDQSFRPVVPIKYDTIIVDHEFKSGGFPITAQRDNNWGLLNSNGQELTSFIYTSPIRYKYGLAVVKMDGKIGFLNFAGKQVLPCMYDEISYSDNENYYQRLVVRKDSLYGLIDTSGKIVIPVIYEKLSPMLYPYEKKYQVSLNKKVGMIDGVSGTTIIPCKYDSFQIPNVYRIGNANYIFGRTSERTEYIDLTSW